MERSNSNSGSNAEKIMDDILSKIIIYSSEKNSDPTKLSKYLSLIRKQRSPKGYPFIETKMRKTGVIRELILYFNRRAAKCNLETKSDGSIIQSKTIVSKSVPKSVPKSQPKTKSTKNDAIAVKEAEAERETQVAIVSNGLSILGNAFAVDQESRREAEKYKFIVSLKIFLESKEFPYSTCEILGRLVKCLANLAVSEKIRVAILRHGVGILVINKLDEIYKKLTQNVTALSVASIEEIIVEKEDEVILNEAFRAVRIFSSDSEFQQHLTRFGAIISVGRFLRFSYNQTLFSEILRALSILACSIKGLSRKNMEDLTDPEGCDRDILFKIIGFLKTHHAVSKIAEPALICLTYLANNTVMAKALIEFEVFEAALEATKHTEETLRLEKLLRLFVILTKDSSPHNGYLSTRLRLACCPQMGETLKILTNSKLKDYHRWLLSLYEHLYEEKLKDLVSRGIIGILDTYVRQEWGEFSMESLRLKLSALDEDTCNVHTTSGSDRTCPFYPKYSCNSPSYKQFEEETGLLNSNSNDSGEDSDIPTVMGSKAFSSLDRSLPCSPGSINYPFSPRYSPAVSPRKSPPYSFSPSSPGCSDDEGIYSSSSRSPVSYNGQPSENEIHPSTKNGFDDHEYSGEEEFDTESEPQNIVEINQPPSIDSDAKEPPAKKLKLDYVHVSGSSSSSGSSSGQNESMKETVGIGNKDITFVDSNSKSDDKDKHSSKQEIQLRSNKISAILGILSKCSHFQVLPPELTVFLPFLLEMIWSGRLSVEKRNQLRTESNSEDLVQLRRLCFQRAFRIVFRICSDINVFSKLIQDNVIPCMYRIFVYDLKVRNKDDPNQVKVREFINDYSAKIMDALVGILGSQNETGGWRQGYFQTICYVGEMDKDYTNAILSIPLLYRGQCPIYRDFEEKTRNWDGIFEMLVHVDDISFTEFQNCILALTCISQTKGLKWVDAEKASKRKLLYLNDSQNFETTMNSFEQHHAPANSNINDNGPTVLFELDDGSKLNVIKKCLTESSSAFAAMFDGHFVETRKQGVHLRDTSKAALHALITQIYQQFQPEPKIGSEANVTYATNQIDLELSTLFELLLLSDQFLLDDVYERTLNTLISFYFCPHSAPKIYEESLKFGGSHKKSKDQFSIMNIDLSKLALKYLLVGEDICFTLRSGAFWKLFDSIAPTVIVQGIQDILYPHVRR